MPLYSPQTSGLPFYPAAVGQYYPGDILGANGNRSTGLTYQQARAAPFYAVRPITISKLAVSCVTAIASSTYRMGFWTIDDQLSPFTWASGTRWATLLLDAGTVSTATTGVKVLTLGTPLVIPGNTWFAVGGAPQAVTGAQLHIADYRLGNFSVLGTNGDDATAAINAQPYTTVAQTGVTGALGNFTPSGGEPTGHGVSFFRSA